jgi:hypothetical protein
MQPRGDSKAAAKKRTVIAKNVARFNFYLSHKDSMVIDNSAFVEDSARLSEQETARHDDSSSWNSFSQRPMP